ncbi:hypothetical protein EYF80_025582 [Liparis tanakae]|uniref:Uncharacterized protein n=1 Tax=Liparis tanakae TaxID=230148 RepID=A0A4Z2HH25_9TELE|nr:hypothetical protein EYF80_025582 [Liparis tanakae]
MGTLTEAPHRYASNSSRAMHSLNLKHSLTLLGIVVSHYDAISGLKVLELLRRSVNQSVDIWDFKAAPCAVAANITPRLFVVRGVHLQICILSRRQSLWRKVSSFLGRTTASEKPRESRTPPTPSVVFRRRAPPPSPAAAHRYTSRRVSVPQDVGLYSPVGASGISSVGWCSVSSPFPGEP